MVAVAVHQIAVILFKLDTSQHKDDRITEWVPPKTDTLYRMFREHGTLPTMFVHSWYVDHDQYPDGVAEMIGYWAESRILGGVVLLDRRPADLSAGVDPDTIYFHSDRRGRDI
jgi:hypothetical protein